MGLDTPIQAKITSTNKTLREVKIMASKSKTYQDTADTRRGAKSALVPMAATKAMSQQTREEEQRVLSCKLLQGRQRHSRHSRHDARKLTRAR